MTVEQLMLDLAAEKANNQKAEVSCCYFFIKEKQKYSIDFFQAVRSNLERQNRELREKLEESEEFGKGKSRAMLGALEAKVHALEEQLDNEVRYGQKTNKTPKIII